MTQQIQKIINSAKSGGRVLKKYFGQNLKQINKGTAANFFTQADIDSEKAVLKVLIKEFPDYNIFSEECGLIGKKSDYIFIIDPLDGTNNFALNIPNFAINIALLQKDQIIASVIHHPILDKTYYAQKGKGAYLDGVRLKTNNTRHLSQATVCYSCAYNDPKNIVAAQMGSLTRANLKRVLSNWAPAYDFCLLALGKLEAIVNNDNEIYDFLAGKLIAREAGAVITDFNGNQEKSDKNSKFLASSNTTIHKQLLKIINKW